MSVNTAQTNSALSAFSKATDLHKRILFTILALIVYRFGTYVPLPGINPKILEEVLAHTKGGLLDMFDVFAGGAFQRMTLLALNIMPYISASIIVSMMSMVLPSMQSLRKEGEVGYRKINQYTRYLTVLITIVQGLGIAMWLEGLTAANGNSAVIMSSHLLFRLTTVVSLLGGTMFIVWLGEQITSRGIGNGASLIITVGIIAGLPRAIAKTLEMSRSGQLSLPALFSVAALIALLVFIVVFVERAQRRIVIQYPKRQMGMRVVASNTSYLPIKINQGNVMPPILAMGLMALPLTIIQFFSSNSETASGITAFLSRGSVAYLTIYATLIVIFDFFYTSMVFDPEGKAEHLKNSGGFIAGLRPGKTTAEYLDYVATRLTVLGAFYLASICLFPEYLISHYDVPFYLGGTTLLIVVTVIMETMSQIQSHLVAYQYEGLLRKAQLKGRL